jgi:hypothetical protein
MKKDDYYRRIEWEGSQIEKIHRGKVTYRQAKRIAELRDKRNKIGLDNDENVELRELESEIYRRRL